MTTKRWPGRSVSAILLISAMWLTSLPVSAQDLIAVSSLSGGSSVFVFRSAARSAIRRVVSVTKPVRSKAQQIETVAKIKKQYETEARTAPRTNRAAAVDPAKKAPPTLTAPEASKRFAGIGEYYLAKSDFDQSFDSFRDAIKLDDTNETAKIGYSEALALKGNDLLVKDQGATAKGLFLEAIKYNPKNSAAYFGLGEVYGELDQRPEA
ncbi:MAG TPA: tetratricopeptide repeat protein, partial [Pyrinomonadaceae bacterium]|nr:tetratricopeptide repeat protein [Pyrinomonadaceae bacterium]